MKLHAQNKRTRNSWTRTYRSLSSSSLLPSAGSWLVINAENLFCETSVFLLLPPVDPKSEEPKNPRPSSLLPPHILDFKVDGWITLVYRWLVVLHPPPLLAPSIGEENQQKSSVIERLNNTISTKALSVTVFRVPTRNFKRKCIFFSKS